MEGCEQSAQGGRDLSCHIGPWSKHSPGMEPYLSTKNRALAKLLQGVPSSVKWAQLS